MIYRKGSINDLNELKKLAIETWSQYKHELTRENWETLKGILSNDKTWVEVLTNSYSVVCVNEVNEIVGMSFLVPQGNPTELFDKNWCYLRFVTVDRNFTGQGIGRHLTEKCIQHARETGEKTIALHTSEMMNSARHIYESLGFTILKELEPRLGKKYWLYTLEL